MIDDTILQSRIYSLNDRNVISYIQFKRQKYDKRSTILQSRLYSLKDRNMISEVPYFSQDYILYTTEI